MKIGNEQHAALPWRIHDLANDFELEDVWQLPVVGDERPGHDFAAFSAQMEFSEPPSGGATGALFRLRYWLGNLFDWDNDERLPIPGCKEISIAARLPADLRAEVPAYDPKREFQLVYSLQSERLLEISNATVHALMHLGWVQQDNGEYIAHMAVYAKPRGFMGRMYMGLIKPFRLWIVYPALLRSIKHRWSQRASQLGALQRGAHAS